MADVGSRSAPGMAGTGDASFDKAFEEARADAIRKRDTAAMKRRQNLQRYGSTPTSADVERLAAGVPLPAQQWNFPDAAGRSGAMSRADAALAATMPIVDDLVDRRSQTGPVVDDLVNRPGTARGPAVQQLANRPGSLTARMIKLAQAPPDTSSFVDASGTTRLTRPDSGAPTREWDPKLMDAIGTARRAAEDISLASGRPETGMATFRDANGQQRTVTSNAPAQAAMQQRRMARTGTTLAQNATASQADQAAELARRQAKVDDRAKNYWDTFRSMRGGSQGNGQQVGMYDPMANYNLGLFTGGPEQALRLAQAASDANLRRSEGEDARQQFRDSLNQHLMTTMAQMAQSGMQHQERMGELDRGNRVLEGQLARDRNTAIQEEMNGIMSKDPSLSFDEVRQIAEGNIARRFGDGGQVGAGAPGQPQPGTDPMQAITQRKLAEIALAHPGDPDAYRNEALKTLGQGKAPEIDAHGFKSFRSYLPVGKRRPTLGDAFMQQSGMRSVQNLWRIMNGREPLPDWNPASPMFNPQF